MSNQMGARRQMRLEKIERWKSTARAHGGPLGYFLSYAFDLCSTVGSQGNMETVYYAVESLKNELGRAKERDHDRGNPLHNLIYGLTECFGEMVESLNEERRSEQEENQVDLGMDHQEQFGMDFNDDYQLHMPKQEVIDLTDDISLPVNSPDPELIAEDEPPRLDRQQPTEALQMITTVPTLDFATLNLKEGRSVHISSRSASPHLDVVTLDDQPGMSRQHRMDDEPQRPARRRRAMLVRARQAYDTVGRLNTPQSLNRMTCASGVELVPSSAPTTPAGEQLMPCDKCDRSFDASKKLKLHQFHVHGNLHLPCDQCDMTFTTQRGLKVHNYKHARTTKRNANSMSEDEGEDEDVEYRPAAKRAATVDPTTPAATLSTPTAARSHPCGSCDKSFDTQKGLTLHATMNHRSNETVNNVCPHPNCGAVRTDPHNMTQHLRSAHGETLHSASLSTPKARPSVHGPLSGTKSPGTKLRSNVCPHCGIIRNEHKLMMYHLRRDHGDKPYECLTCGEKFAYKIELSEHWDQEGHGSDGRDTSIETKQDNHIIEQDNLIIDPVPDPSLA